MFDSYNGWLFLVNNNGVANNLAFDSGSDRSYSGLSLPLGKPVFVAILGDSSASDFGNSTNQHRFVVWDGDTWQYSDGTQFINIRLQGLELISFNNGTRQFDGVIDDVHIYNGTLSQTQLDALTAFPPTLTIAPSGSGQATISWTPADTNYILQETASLSSTNWINSPSGATNPIVVPARNATTFYRLFKP